MSLACANVPVDAGEPAFARNRAILLRELEARPLLFVEPTRPDVAYMLLFAEALNDGICRRLRELLARGTPAALERGVVYVFRDVRDGGAVVKIGSTTHLKRRMTEWRRRLAVEEEAQLVPLFASTSAHVRLAEALVHTALFCEWRPRVHAGDGAMLIEYFAVKNLTALRLFVRACARYASWYARASRRPARLDYERHALPVLGIDSP